MSRAIDPARALHAHRPVHALHALETSIFSLVIKYLAFCTCKSARAYVKPLKLNAFARARTTSPLRESVLVQETGARPPCACRLRGRDALRLKGLGGRDAWADPLTYLNARRPPRSDPPTGRQGPEARGLPSARIGRPRRVGAMSARHA